MCELANLLGVIGFRKVTRDVERPNNEAIEENNEEPGEQSQGTEKKMRPCDYPTPCKQCTKSIKRRGMRRHYERVHKTINFDEQM